MTELSEIYFDDPVAPATAITPRATEPLSAHILIGKLRSARRKHQLISIAQGSGIIIIAGVALLLCCMIFDWCVGLPMWARAALLVFDAAALLWLVWWMLILPVWKAPDDAAVALLVEEARPEFHSRLISAIQLAQPNGLARGASRAIARRMIEQTTELAQSIRFADVVHAGRLWRTLSAACVTIAAFTGLFFWGRPVSAQLLQRAFLANIPVPYFTEVEVVPLPAIVARGSTVNFRAIARQVIPRTGIVVVQYPSRQIQKLSLDRTDEIIRKAAAFARVLTDVQEPFDYRIKLNDNTTGWYHVDVQAPPAVAGVTFSVTYPRYTRRAPENQSPDALSILRGSTLHVRLTATKQLKSSSIHLFGTDTTIQLTRDINNTAIASADVPLVDHVTGLGVKLIDNVGLTNTDPIVYPLKTIPDRPPAVVITYPKNKQELATRKATFLISFNATDDYGVDSVSLNYRVDGGGMVKQPVQIKRGDRSVDGSESLVLGSIKVPAGKAELTGSDVEYWIEAKDANDITGPGVSESEHFHVKCVTEDEKRAQLAQLESQIIGAFGNTAADQQSVNKDVGDMVKSKGKP
jgi:hypothetical protein